jgi:hypothetical protein
MLLGQRVGTQIMSLVAAILELNISVEVLGASQACQCVLPVEVLGLM